MAVVLGDKASRTQSHAGGIDGYESYFDGITGGCVALELSISMRIRERHDRPPNARNVTWSACSCKKNINKVMNSTDDEVVII